MTSLPTSIALHLGAHKTASTHLQRSLAAADLSGVQVITPRQLRDKGQTLPERFGFPLDEANAPDQPVDVAKVLAEIADSADRLVMSDENFAGKLNTGWGRVPTPVYQTAPRRLGQLSRAIAQAGGPAVDVFLAIRDPADYLTSIYSQVLRGGRRVWPDAFIAKNDPAAIDWVNYVKNLRGVPGVGQVVVWRYEDYQAHFGQITRALTGGAEVAPLADRVQVRLSHQAVTALLQAKQAGVPLSAAEAAKAHPSGADAAPFTLYDGPTRALSEADYARQWTALSGIPDVTLLQPE